VKTVNNTFFALLSQVMPKFSATLLFILLARQTGRAEAGAYSIATSLLTIAVLISSLGFEDLLVREVVRDKRLARTYFRGFVTLRVLVTLVVWLLFSLLVRYAFDYAVPVEAIVLLLGLTLLPESATDLAQSLLVATGRLRWAAISSTLVAISQFAIGAFVLATRPDVQTLLVVLVAHSFIGCALNVLLARSASRQHQTEEATHAFELQAWFPLRFWLAQLKLTPAFIAISVFSVLELQIDVALLSFFKSIEDVGVYGAAKTVIASLAIFAQAVRIVVYPRLAGLYSAAPPSLSIFYRRLFQYLAALSLPLAAGLIVGAPALVDLLYKAEFSASALPLQILAVSLAVNFLYIPSTRLMVAAHRERQVATLLAVSFGINLVCNLLLIPRWGAIGSAAARTISITIYFACCELYVHRQLLATQSLAHLVRIVLPLAAMIGAIILLAPFSGILATVAGSVVYVVLLLLLKGIDVVHLRLFAAELRHMLNIRHGNLANSVGDEAETRW